MGWIPCLIVGKPCIEIRENYTILRRQALCPEFATVDVIDRKGFVDMCPKNSDDFLSIFLEIVFTLIQKFGQEGWRSEARGTLSGGLLRKKAL